MTEYEGKELKILATITGAQLLVAAGIVVPDWIKETPDPGDDDELLQSEKETEITIADIGDGNLIAFLTDYPEEGSVALNFQRELKSV